MLLICPPRLVYVRGTCAACARAGRARDVRGTHLEACCSTARRRRALSRATAQPRASGASSGVAAPPRRSSRWGRWAGCTGSGLCHAPRTAPAVSRHSRGQGGAWARGGRRGKRWAGAWGGGGGGEAGTRTLVRTQDELAGAVPASQADVVAAGGGARAEERARGHEQCILLAWVATVRGTYGTAEAGTPRGVRAVRGASRQAALRFWYVQHAGGWYV